MCIPLQTAIEILPPDPEALIANKSSLCQHITTTYIIPDLLHLAAFLLGILYFRIRENEQLYALMEKVSFTRSVS